MSDFIVECRGLSKAFASQAETLRVLSGLDLFLPSASSCAIMGASGSGKSTLLSILGGLETADSGSIRVAGYVLAQTDPAYLDRYRRTGVGFVFQFHHLLKDFTALENVALPAYLAGVPRAQAWKRAAELLAAMGIADRASHFPSELSGGERQRAAIARALVNGPSLLLADEPTGNLDAANAASVRDLLYSLPAMTGTSILIATHDADLAGRAGHRYRLAGGKLETA